MDFDLSLSICVVTQLLASVRDWTHEPGTLTQEQAHAQMEAGLAHAGLLLSVTRAGGAVVWATDALDSRSSDWTEVQTLMGQDNVVAAIRSIWHNPGVLGGVPQFVSRLEDRRLTTRMVMGMWSWGFEEDRTYLVIGGWHVIKDENLFATHFSGQG